MPYYANGIYYPWPNVTAAITNSSDPVSANISTINSGLPILFPILLGALYVYLWMMFRQAPSRFKFVIMTFLVFIISFFMAATGFVADSALNFVVFAIAYFLEFLLNRRAG